MSETDPTCSRLRRTLMNAAEKNSLQMQDLTVLSTQVDPFRIDTPARHRDAEWLANAAATLGLQGRQIHLRGLHYAVAMSDQGPKPDGSRYVNDDANWAWLENAAKAARWLGYIPFDAIFDKRNDAPVVRLFEEAAQPWPYLNVGLQVEIPETVDINPIVGLRSFEATQAYRLVLVGEKSSLLEVLGTVATRYGADLYLPTGEMSDTQIHQIAKHGAEDGRPLVVFYFADCDPSGWQMPVSVGRKLQAFRTSLFPELDFTVHRVALTPDHVRQHDLPSSPLKAKEKRGDRWRAAMGVDQTEIDVLTALQPDLLREIAIEAIEPYFDSTLTRRANRAQNTWIDEAQIIVDDTIDQYHLDRLRADAETKLGELRMEIDAINDQLQVDASDFDLPPVPEVPTAETSSDKPLPLISSAWSFTKQTRRLIASKDYREVGQ